MAKTSILGYPSQEEEGGRLSFPCGGGVGKTGQEERGALLLNKSSKERGRVGAISRMQGSAVEDGKIAKKNGKTHSLIA